MSYVLRNTSEHIEKKGDTHWWRWTAFIEVNDDSNIEDIKYVEYQLHSSFKNPIKKSRIASDNFSITLKGWGTFLLRARIVFKDPDIQSLSLSHTLVFENEDKDKDKDKDKEYKNLIAINNSETVVVFAQNRFNHTELYLQKDEEYEISVEKIKNNEQKWMDGNVKCNANGWHREGVQLGLANIAIAGMKPLLRVAKAERFCLCGSIGSTDDTAFEIGEKNIVSIKKSGELCLFANNSGHEYENNSGELIVAVKRVS